MQLIEFFTACEKSTYGDNCAKKCSIGCLNNECDNIQGTCSNGCKAGYIREKCNKRKIIILNIKTLTICFNFKKW